MVAFPATGEYLAAVRQSSRNLRLAANISITPDRIYRLLSSPAFINSFPRVSKNHGLALPLNFSSHLDQLNFISVLSLLNFASGYRVPLHQQTGRGAWDSIRALMFSLYITSASGEGDLLSAKGLRVLNVSKIAELMSINLHVERPHDTIPGITVGELGGPLYGLVRRIVDVLNETGEVLENSGYQNLGAFVAETLRSAAKVPKEKGADIILERLVRAFPAFQDMSEVHGQPIYCFKKAIFLVEAIKIIFGPLNPPPFYIPSTSHLPVFSDNVLPSLLVHLGVIDLSASPSLCNLFPGAGSEENLKSLLSSAPSSTTDENRPKVPLKEGPSLTSDQAYQLRAAAVDACELLIDAARSLDLNTLSETDLDWMHSVTLPNMDMWLWAVAKDRSDYRTLQRFVATDTIFF